MPEEVLPPAIASWVLSYVADEARPERLDAWADRVTERILAEFPELTAPPGRDEDLSTDVRDAVREHWRAFLGELGQSEQRFHLVEGAARLAEEIAQRQIPLETLTRVYRVAQQEVWHYVAGLVADLPADVAREVDGVQVLIYFWSRAGSWLDESIDASTGAYQAARARALAGAAAQRYEAARALLDGELTDPREASAALGGYPITVQHTALVLSVENAEHAGSLEALAGDLSRAMGATSPLVVKPGGRQLWAWVATRDPLDLTGLAETTDGLVPDGVRVGVGSSAAGLAGFAASHREALGALRVTATGGSRLASYVEVELPVLLGCTPEVDRFVARRLGPLAGDDESLQRIRETVAAFLDSGGSSEETSRVLVVHRNTVRYRLGQAEELLGRPIAKVSAELAVALHHHELFHRR